MAIWVYALGPVCTIPLAACEYTIGWRPGAEGCDEDGGGKEGGDRPVVKSRNVPLKGDALSHIPASVELQWQHSDVSSWSLIQIHNCNNTATSHSWTLRQLLRNERNLEAAFWDGKQQRFLLCTSISSLPIEASLHVLHDTNWQTNFGHACSRLASKINPARRRQPIQFKLGRMLKAVLDTPEVQLCLSFNSTQCAMYPKHSETSGTTSELPRSQLRHYFVLLCIIFIYFHVHLPISFPASQRTRGSMLPKSYCSTWTSIASEMVWSEWASKVLSCGQHVQNPLADLKHVDVFAHKVDVHFDLFHVYSINSEFACVPELLRPRCVVLVAALLPAAIWRDAYANALVCAWYLAGRCTSCTSPHTPRFNKSI